MKYRIADIERNSWNSDGSHIEGKTWLETNNFKDVVKWCTDNEHNTAILNSYVFGLMDEPVACGTILSTMFRISYFADTGDRPNYSKRNIIEEIKSWE